MTAPIIQARVIGSAAVVRKFGVTAPENVRIRARNAVRGLGLTLQRNVVTGNLAGRVLNKRTGRLQRSVNTRFSENGDVFGSRTGTKLVYGRAWELGFSTPAFDIYPKNAEALFWPGAAHPVKVVHMPPQTHAARPWLRPALNDMRPVIDRTLAMAMRGL